MAGLLVVHVYGTLLDILGRIERNIHVSIAFLILQLLLSKNGTPFDFKSGRCGQESLP